MYSVVPKSWMLITFGSVEFELNLWAIRYFQDSLDGWSSGKIVAEILLHNEFIHLCHSKKKKKKKKMLQRSFQQQSLIKLTPLKERFKCLKVPNLSRTQIIWLEWSSGPLVRLLKPWQQVKNLWRTKITFRWKILFTLRMYLWIIYILR
jgi:hypothetical protein